MRLRRKLTALLLALALALGLCACRQEEPQASFDAKVYVEGLLQCAYQGEPSQEYLDLVGITEEQGQSVYENSLYLEAQVFAFLYNIEYPNDLYEEIMDLYREIFSHAKFQVVSAVLEEDGSYSVQVDIEPIDIVQKAAGKLEEAKKPFFEKYPSASLNTMTTKDYQAYDAEWARLIIDTYKEILPDTGNLEKRSVTVKLEKNEEGYYTISDEEFKKLGEYIIDYSVPEPVATPSPELSGEPEPSPDGESSPAPDGEPTPTPGENDPVPPTTASPLPEPEDQESEGPEESKLPQESPEETE
ncbi:MAG: hypothetical protein J6C43_00150 [Oscillospiraceae bacterium]|nr:hypothetical protein [Oscillospiraceae bacterium]MBP3521127.1 hypothetical protein [Oscillospiraceae bacterium]